MADTLTSVRRRHTFTLAMGELGTLIRTARTSRGLSLRKLEELAGIGFNTIRDIERGDIGRPTPETLQGLASALDIPYRDLALAAYGANGHSASRTPEGNDG